MKNLSKEASAKNILRFISMSPIDNTFSYQSAYKKLVNGYLGYTLNDILILCKIDRLLERELISQEIHDYLYELIDLKNKLNVDLAYDYKNVDNEQERIKKINEINLELDKYGVNIKSFNDLLDSAINQSIYSEGIKDPSLYLIQKL